MRRAFTLCLVATVLLVSPVKGRQAETFYVSTAGNDAQTCGQAQSSAAPKRTIMNAATCLGASDTLMIRGGTYAEMLNFVGWPGPSLGTDWASAITIQSYNDEAVTIRPPVGSGQGLMLGPINSTDTTTPKYIKFIGGATNKLTIDCENVGNNCVHMQVYDHTTDPVTNPVHHFHYERVRVTDIRANMGHLMWANWGVVGVIIRDSEFDTTGGYTWWGTGQQGTYIAANDLLIENSYFHDIHGCALANTSSWVGRQVNNHIYRNNRVTRFGLGASACGGIQHGEGSGHEIYNNVVWDGNTACIVIGWDTGATGTKVYNNTVYGCAIGIEIRGGQINTEVKNNIAFGNATAYINAGTGTVVATNLFGVDPSFVNAAAADFSLEPGSAARNTGTTLAVPTDDFLGVPRPQEAEYDIGAYEYDPVDSPPAPCAVVPGVARPSNCPSAPLLRRLRRG